jgi:hypothetical protein
MSLQFGSEVREPVRSRIEYAFRVFAAVYGHLVLMPSANNTGVQCFYGELPPAALKESTFHIPHLYRPEAPAIGGKFAKYTYADTEVYLAYGLDNATARPDWLGEIFLWLSSSYERGIIARDSAGRIPYSEMVFARSGLSPRKAHAARLMAWLEGAISGGQGEKTLPRAPSPLPGVHHIVVCSHDIDFYYTNRTTAFVRHAKNIALALFQYHSGSFFRANLQMMLGLLIGKRTGDYIRALLEAASGEYDFASTLFVVGRRAHRRDPNYRIEEIANRLSVAGRQHGFSIGIHGSYRSVTEDRSLAQETRDLRALTHGKVLANRQHWLRFGEHKALFDEVERAGLLVESTLGFSEEIGFRNGACFAFPPYDFAQERPHNFLEVPLVVMDGALRVASRASGKHPQALADEVLAESRRFGWGGVSLVWHNPIEAISVPMEINDVFWNCAKQKKQFREKWVSADEFLSACAARYRRAGLLAYSAAAVHEPLAEVSQR